MSDRDISCVLDMGPAVEADSLGALNAEDGQKAQKTKDDPKRHKPTTQPAMGQEESHGGTHRQYVGASVTEPRMQRAADEITCWKGQAQQQALLAQQAQDDAEYYRRLVHRVREDAEAQSVMRDGSTVEDLMQQVDTLKLEVERLRGETSTPLHTGIGPVMAHQYKTYSQPGSFAGVPQEIHYLPGDFAEMPQGKTVIHSSAGLERIQQGVAFDMHSPMRETSAQLEGAQRVSPGMAVAPPTPGRSATLPVTAWGAIPKLMAFSGDTAKDAYPYRRWRFDVIQLQQAGYPERTVGMAVVRSCRGSAADMLQTLQDGFTVEEVLQSFDKHFGSVETTESLLATFYSAHQKVEESVNAWGCRLESWLARPQVRHLSTSQRAAMLRERFWRGLHGHITRNALRHRFDAGVPYEELLVQAREVELELFKGKMSKKSAPSDATSSNAKSTTKAKVATQAVKPDLQDQLVRILDRLTALEKQLPKTKSSQGRESSHDQSRDEGQLSRGGGQRKPTAAAVNPQPTSKGPKPRKCFNCGMEGHFKRSCPQLNQQ